MPSLGNLPNPGIKPAFPTSPTLAGRFFTASVTWDSVPSLHGKYKGKKNGSNNRFYFLGLQNTFRPWLYPWKLKDTCSLEGKLGQHRQHVKKQKHHFVDKGLYRQSSGLSCSHVWMWEVGHNEDWVLKNWYFPIVVEKILECHSNCKVKPVNPKGSQPWIFIGRTVAEVEAPLFWLPDSKTWLIGKYSNSGKDWRQKEKGVAEDEMVR